MSIIATALKHLIAAGVSGDDLVRAVAEMEAATPVKVDRVAEKRRAYDRERKRKSTGIPPESAERVSPKEYISNPHPVTPSAKADIPQSDFSTRVVEAWNRDTAGTPLPQARPLTPDRRKHLAARAKEHGEEAVFSAIRNMAASDFHSGKSGKWTEGNIGWLLKSPENFTKMLERASDGKSATPISPSQKLDALAQQSALYKRMGRDEEAAEIDRETERIRRSSSIGDLTQQFRQAAH